TLQEPGITRDRLTREAEWRGRHFTVVDTGGLVPGSKAEIENEINRQVAIALEQAQAVVLVVDGTAGLHPLDQEIADRLRHRGIRFLLAVNKCDRKREFDTAEFHRLGAEWLFAISAEHGTGVDDLLDELLRQLPEQRLPRREKPLSLAILGRPNVGKSTFLNQLLGQERAITSPEPGTTRDAVEELFEFENRLLRLVDTAGIRRRSRVDRPVEYYSVSRALDQIERCDVAMVLFPADEGPTRQDKRIFNLVLEHDKGVVAVANKFDLVPVGLRNKVRDYVSRELDLADVTIPIVYSVAVRNRGVAEAVRQAIAVHSSGGTAIPSKRLRETLLERLQQQPPSFRCRVLGISQVGVRPPRFRVRLSDPDSARPDWYRFVANQLRQTFGFFGYPVRIRVGR
ncbi:MAG: ribosome biogenesis GTPase Der, partial [candidate division WOR-3 bacterium]